MAGIAPQTRRIAVVTSGNSRGSNLRAIHDAFRNGAYPVEIALCIVTKRSAPIVTLCQDKGIPVEFISSKDLSTFETKLRSLLDEYQIDLIALAGFLKKLSISFIRDLTIPILNIHPALLPRYGGEGMYGIKVHDAVFAAREKRSGATVHYVNRDYDSGRVVLQEAIDITDCTSPQDIAAKVLKVEHHIYAKAILKVLKIH